MRTVHSQNLTDTMWSLVAFKPLHLVYVIHQNTELASVLLLHLDSVSVAP